ncbi:MAG: acyl-CoA dehydrogenase [Caulobacterales bacterium]
MDFSLTSEQEALKDSVSRFCERDYSFELRRKIVAAQPAERPNHWAVFAELGWLGAGLSEDKGGFGGGPIENFVIAEQLGRALALEPFSGHVLALQALAAGGAPSDLIEAAISGETRIALAHLEAEGRGAEGAVTTRAEGDALSGAKVLIQGGAQADQFLVSAQDKSGVSLFLVDASAKGVERKIYRTLDNHLVCDLHLNGAAGTLIGNRDGALPAIEEAIDHGIVALCAEALGAMDVALWMTRDYIKTRKQFGTTINNFQALQHRMADMLIETELARSILYQGLAALMQPDPAARRQGVAATKALVAQCGLFVCGQAIQLHGGIGVTEEHSIGHFYKRLYVIAQLFGNAEIHKQRFMQASAS